MKKGLTQMVFVLDMSGSMSPLTMETIGGYNAMIADQKKEEGDALVTTVLFDHRYNMIHDGVNIKEVKDMTTAEYMPTGMTAMLDAVGMTIKYEQYRKAYAYESRIDGVKCLVVNRRCNSLIFGNLIKDYPIVAIWVFDGEKYKYSIYSDKPDVNCSKIAERYGGGGHKGASGFVSEKMIFNKVK